MLGKNLILRRLFYKLLNLIFLRAWYVRKELWRLKRKFKLKPRVLDAGMGFGQYSDRMTQIFDSPEIIGLELDWDHFYGSEEYFRLNYPNIELIYGDVQILPLKNDACSLVLSVDVMEHVLDDEAAFAEFFRILKPGGYFVMHTPRNTTGESADNNENPGWTVGEHVRDGYSDEEIINDLTTAGFEIEKIVHGYGIMGKIAWRLLQQIPIGMYAKFGLMAIIPLILYLIVIFPIGFLLMLLDIIPGDHSDGSGLLVTAQKPSLDI